MNDRKKMINELRFQLNSKEVKEEHYPIQLAARDAEKILTLLKEQEAVEPKISSTEQRCGNCNKVIEMDGWIACPWCGKHIDWNGWWKKNGTRN